MIIDTCVDFEEISGFEDRAIRDTMDDAVINRKAYFPRKSAILIKRRDQMMLIYISHSDVLESDERHPRSDRLIEHLEKLREIFSRCAYLGDLCRSLDDNFGHNKKKTYKTRIVRNPSYITIRQPYYKPNTTISQNIVCIDNYSNILLQRSNTLFTMEAGIYLLSYKIL